MSMKVTNKDIEFSCKLIAFILHQSGTESGLAEIFKQARDEYIKPKKSYLLYWIYKHTRKRTHAFDSTISSLETMGSQLTRLQEFHNFIRIGGWEKTSANTVLMQHLIAAMQKNNREISVSENFIFAQRDCLFELLNATIRQQEANYPNAEEFKHNEQSHSYVHLNEADFKFAEINDFTACSNLFSQSGFFKQSKATRAGDLEDIFEKMDERDFSRNPL